MVAAEHEHPVQAFDPDRATHRSANAFARGARIGVLTMFTPSERKTSSNGRENLASRSRIENRMPRSPSPTARFRACWVTHAESGFLVTPKMCTRPRAIRGVKSGGNVRLIFGEDLTGFAQLPPGRHGERRGEPP